MAHAMILLVTDLISGERVRGRALVVPRWWLDAARAAVEESQLGLVDLGVKLARAVGRDEPWTHGTLSRFLSGRNVTDQIADAMVALFDLPKPVYYPRDLSEALLFRAAESKRDQRLADADRALGQLESESTRRQTGRVVSPHEPGKVAVVAGNVRAPRRG